MLHVEIPFWSDAMEIGEAKLYSNIFQLSNLD